MRKCNKCRLEKSEDSFYKYKDGKFYGCCKPCHNRRANRENNGASVRKVQAAKSAFLRTVKDVPCVDCGVRYPYYVMDLDHVRGDKVKGVSYMIAQSSWADLKAEIEKCEVVCSNCHRIRTHNRLTTTT